MSFSITILDTALSKKVDAFAALVDYEARHKLLAEVIRSELLNARTSNAHTKTRAEIRGGGKKPWKQKGTGRARHGSTRSPIWVGGGVAWGPKNDRNWHRKINKSARLAALKSIFKDRLIAEAVYQFPEKFAFEKTKDAVDTLANLETKKGIKPTRNVVIYTTADKDNLRGFVSSGVKLLNAANLKITTIVNGKTVILTPAATEMLETRMK